MAKRFKTESELCAAFIEYAAGFGWTAYPETRRKDCAMMVRRYRINCETILRHPDIVRAARRLGGFAKLAKKIGVKPHTLWGWSRMIHLPVAGRYHPKSCYTPDVEKRLEEECGKRADELFPASVREACKGVTWTNMSPKEIPADKLVGIDELTRSRLVESDDTVADTSRHLDLNDAAVRILGTLDDRERLLLEMRFGLFGRRESTLAEIGEELGVVRERARQIEQKVLARLRSLPSISPLAQLIE